ncbi:putative receptor protein kinase TMK1-like [Trifolium medium]|uniref:Putative receptor protein kinase TMK1-like n=1 Tax=Trifolium medium TaxID=97028 RepID=A0A392Q314_9FABA|nr:putative receptor protein kinase TMK1-like [Trifolium medium]
MLQTISLGGNDFSSIPDSCFQGLTSLQKLSMASNVNLAPWTFPTELSQSSNLVSLDLGQTNLVGRLPDIFNPLVSLQDLRLSYNKLTGDLPMSFSGSGIHNLWLNNQDPNNNTFGFTGSISVLDSKFG